MKAMALQAALAAAFVAALALAPYPSDAKGSGGGHSSGSHRGAHRSPEARRDFKRKQPCPATGSSRGACPGYVVDHVVPLACGGADAPSNMQWQTVAEGRAKDAWETRGCRGGRK